MLTALILTGCAPESTEFDAEAAASTPACTEEGVEVGQCAPDFTLTDIDGTTHALSDLAGQTVMADFSGFS